MGSCQAIVTPGSAAIASTSARRGRAVAGWAIEMVAVFAGLCIDASLFVLARRRQSPRSTRPCRHPERRSLSPPQGVPIRLDSARVGGVAAWGLHGKPDSQAPAAVLGSGI